MAARRCRGRRPACTYSRREGPPHGGSLDRIAIEAYNAVGRSVEIVAGPDDPQTVRVDLRAAEADKPGVYRVFDMVERDEKKRLVGGTTFITLGGQ